MFSVWIGCTKLTTVYGWNWFDYELSSIDRKSAKCFTIYIDIKCRPHAIRHTTHWELSNVWHRQKLFFLPVFMSNLNVKWIFHWHRSMPCKCYWYMHTDNDSDLTCFCDSVNRIEHAVHILNNVIRMCYIVNFISFLNLVVRSVLQWKQHFWKSQYNLFLFRVERKNGKIEREKTSNQKWAGNLFPIITPNTHDINFGRWYCAFFLWETNVPVQLLSVFHSLGVAAGFIWY